MVYCNLKIKIRNRLHLTKKNLGLLVHLGYFCGRRLTQGTLYTINESIVQSTLEK
jgi:hypothetical protein